MSYERSLIAEVQQEKRTIIDHPTVMEQRLSFNVQLHNELEKNRKATVIMLQPASIDEKLTDLSISRILSWFCPSDSQQSDQPSTQLSDIQLNYLFPIYCEEDNKLENSLQQLNQLSKDNDKLKAILKQNKAFLQKTIASSDLVVVAWGNPPKGIAHSMFYKYVNQVLKILRKSNKRIYVFEILNPRLNKAVSLTDQGNPIQPSSGKIVGLKEISMDSFFGINVL